MRATASKALGGLMRGMGEENLPDLVPWLVDTLKTETASVERSGGAQGLCEVLVSLGDARVKQVRWGEGPRSQRTGGEKCMLRRVDG